MVILDKFCPSASFPIGKMELKVNLSLRSCPSVRIHDSKWAIGLAQFSTPVHSSTPILPHPLPHRAPNTLKLQASGWQATAQIHLPTCSCLHVIKCSKRHDGILNLSLDSARYHPVRPWASHLTSAASSAQWKE